MARPIHESFDWAREIFTVGTTGTNGKTSTTLLVARALRAGGHAVLVETTLGYAFDDEPVEVPRTVGGFYEALAGAARRGARRAAIEVTSEALAQGFAKRWRFDVAVFTNLTRDHFDAHGSWEHYLASKAQLFVHLAPGGAAVLNGCDPASLLLDRVTPEKVQRLYYDGVPSRGEPRTKLDLAARSVRITREGTRVELEPSALGEQLGGGLSIKLVGGVYAENALAAACGALSAGVGGGDVARGLADCPVVPGRFEVSCIAIPTVVVDFAHLPDALARTCDTARELAQGARVIVVFGAGGERDQGKRGAMGEAVGQRADEAIITTDNPRREDPRAIARALADGAAKGKARVRQIPDRSKAIEEALSLAARGDVVVIAGKGHEKGQLLGGETVPFSDVECVRKLLAPAT